MCPIWPLHLIILYLLALFPLWTLCQALPTLMATFNPNATLLSMDYTEYVDINVTGTGMLAGDEFVLISPDAHISAAGWNSTDKLAYKLTEDDVDKIKENDNIWHGKLRILGNFIGRTDMLVSGKRGDQKFTVDGALPVTVVRPKRFIDKLFIFSVVAFVSLIFINFGCAMHWPTVTAVLKRPIGPAIGMVGQFLFMPLMSFGLGFLIFPNSPAMRLGMFFTGVSPAGGASNIWTYILGGNFNLSLAMTTLSTLASFGFMPLWLFSLGQIVFANAKIVVPYARIAEVMATLIVPLAIGLAMQRYTPRLAAFMVRILKGFSTALLMFIIIFAIVTNLYIFELFTWEIIVAGMGVPWLGYIAGYVLARVLRQPHADALAISIETGVQNTGIAIFLLRYALPQPEADLTTVVPVSVAIMTPIPMTCIYIVQKIMGCVRYRIEHKKIVEESGTPVSDAAEPRVATIDGPKQAQRPAWEPACLASDGAQSAGVK